MWVFRRAELPIVSQEETELSDWKVRLALISKPNLRLLFFPHKPWLAEPCLGDVSPWAGKLPDLQTNHFMVRTPKSAAVISRGALSLPAPGEPWSLRCVLEMPQSFALYLAGDGMRGGQELCGSHSAQAPYGNCGRDEEEPHQHKVLLSPPNLLSLPFEPKEKA